MINTTEMKVRVDEHARRTQDVDRYGWIQAEASGERTRNLRVVLGLIVGLVVRRPVARPASGILTGGNVSAPGTSPRGAA